MPLFISACGGGSSNNQTASLIKYTGVAQKGPFLIDSLVTIMPLDASGEVTGNSILTRVDSSNGTFSYTVPETWGVGLNNAIEISINGVYIDEATGENTSNHISLTAITNNPAMSSVNILTDWAAKRTRVLIEQGKSLDSAIQSAEEALFSIFGINNIHQLDLSETNDFAEDTALLLLLSGALMDVANDGSFTPQTLVDFIASDFSDDGQLNAVGDDWFKRMQSRIRDNPQAHTSRYAKILNANKGFNAPTGDYLPSLIPLASRPVANVPSEILAKPGDTVTLDGSASNDSGNIINYTWFRVDQQTEYNVPVSDRFISSPTIKAPSDSVVRAAPNGEISLLYALVVTDDEKLTHTGITKVIIKADPLVNNNPPVADSRLLETNNDINTDEDVPALFSLTGSDPDGDAIRFIMASTPLVLSNGLVDGTPPDLTYTPTLNNTLGDRFNFTVNDGSLNSAPATVELTVNPINDKPVANAGPDQTVEECTLVTLDGSGSLDVEDGGILTNNYTWTQVPNGSQAVTLNDSTIVNPVFRAPALNNEPCLVVAPPLATSLQLPVANEVLTFSLTVVDTNVPAALSNPDTVSITVTPAGRPKANTFTMDINQDSPTEIPKDPPNTGKLGGTDPQNDVLTITGITTPANGIVDTVDLGGGNIYTYFPNFGFCGVDSFDYHVSDGVNVSTPATVTINVNCKPVAGPVPDTQLISSTVDITLTGSDSDGTIATYEIVTPPANGFFATPISFPTLTYIPSQLPQTDSFTFRVIDNQGFASEPATVNILVGNSPPIASSQALTIVSDLGLSIDLHDYSFDPDNDPITFEVIGAPSLGGVEFQFSNDFVNDGIVVAIPLDSGVSSSFQYRVMDNAGGQSTIETISASF